MTKENKGLEYLKKNHLSFSSLKLLSTSQWQWWDRYINGNRDDDNKIYFVVGKAVHGIIEDFNKTGKWLEDKRDKYLDNNLKEEDLVKGKKEFDCALLNYRNTNPIRADLSEYTLKKKYEYKDKKLKVPLLGIIDARKDNILIDYKAVASFTDLVNDGMNKLPIYELQAAYYLLLEELNGTPAEAVKFIEIKKNIPNLMYLRKEHLLELAGLPADMRNNKKLTKEKIIEEYNIKPQGTQEIIFKNSSKLMKRIKSVIEYHIDIIEGLNEYTLQIPLGDMFIER